MNSRRRTFRSALLTNLARTLTLAALLTPVSAHCQRSEPVGTGTWPFSYPADTVAAGLSARPAVPE